MDLVTALKDAQSPDHNTRTAAETFLNQAIQSQYGEFLLALCAGFASEESETGSRQLAGLFIKNLIDAKDQTRLLANMTRWLEFSNEEQKAQIRSGFLRALQSQVPIVRHTAAQVIGAFGAADLPNKFWPELLPSLLSFVNTPDAPEGCKVASLEALGYLCDTLSRADNDLQIESVNQILSAIVLGMKQENPRDVKFAAVKALNDSLDFTEETFENEAIRDAIMTAVCTATKEPDVKIQVQAFECLATVAALYYDKLPRYIEAIFNLTGAAFQSNNTEVQMPAIEFWNVVCDEEYSILQDIQEEVEGAEKRYFGIAKNALAQLLPWVLKFMTMQDDEEEDDDDDNWNVAKAGAALLEGFAGALHDQDQQPLVDQVLKFVVENVNNANWHLREASIMAYGMLLEAVPAMVSNISQALPVFAKSLQDPKPLVRDSAAWTIARAIEFHRPAIPDNILMELLKALMIALDDSKGKVVTQVCYAFHALAISCSDENEANSNILSHIFVQVANKLLDVGSSSQWETNSVRINAFEAVNKMVENSAQDMQPAVTALLTKAIALLNGFFNANMDSTLRAEVLASLCGLVGEVVRKIVLTEAQCDQIMHLLLQVLGVKSIAQEEAFIAIGYVVAKLERNFLKYFAAFSPALFMGLKSVEEYSLCTVAVGVVGDLCRAFGKDIAQDQNRLDEIMKCLLELLQSPVLHKSVKPHVISVFSDIALAIEGGFERYNVVVLPILKQAGSVTMPANKHDEEMIDYVNELRNAILEAYTGIIQGAKPAAQLNIILAAVHELLTLINGDGEESSEEVIKAAVGLLGDLGQAFESNAAGLTPFYQQPYVVPLINKAREIGDDAGEVAEWAFNTISKTMNRR